MYNDFLDNYRNEYDWIFVCDVDEFLHLTNHADIKSLFDDMPCYDNFDEVLVNWWNISSPDVYYTPKSVQERFTHHDIDKSVFHGGNLNKDCHVKCFIKGKSDIKFMNNNVHMAKSDKMCNACGGGVMIHEKFPYFTFQFCHSVMYLKHYWSKSFTEFFYRKIRFWGNTEVTIDTANEVKEKYIYESGYWSENHEKAFQNIIKKVVTNMEKT